VSVSECYAAGATGSGQTSLQDPGTSSVILTTSDLGLAQSAPVAPTDVVATAAVAGATVSWTASSAGFGNQPVQTYDIAVYNALTQAQVAFATVPSSETSTSFASLTPGVAYYAEVFATTLVPEGSVDVQYQSPNSAPSNTFVPTNAPEEGVSAASGTDPAPAGTLDDGSPLTASSVGSGTVTVGSYPYSPQAGLASGTTYFDVAATGSLSSVTIDACDPNLSLPLQWWDSTGGAWEDVSPAATMAGGCLTWTATTTSTPSVSELYGTAFASFFYSAPEAPTITIAKPGDGEVTVSWSAPSSDGGSAVTGYEVSASPGKESCSTTGATSCTVSGLTNATSYAFSVTATNGIGTSGPSSAVSAIPALVPGAPSHVAATPGNASATVSWHAPKVTGGSPITGYVVRTTPPTPPCTTRGTSCKLTGLVNATTYQVTVAAKNAVGTGPATAAVPVRPRSVPGAPSVTGVVAGKQRVTVSWSDLVTNGEPITSYVVTSSPSSKTCTTTSASSCTVTGLTDGSSYTFSVRASNVIGQGPVSAPSAAAVPGQQGPPALALAVAGTFKTGYQLTITATIGSGVSGTIAISDKSGQLCSGTIADGAVACHYTFWSTGSFKLVAAYAGSTTWASTSAKRSVLITQGISPG
jgi:hypothetical protein